MRDNKQKRRRGRAVVLAMCLATSLGTIGCLEEEDITSSVVQEASNLPKFKVKKAKGSYASIKEKEMEDRDSKEIRDLVNKRHLMDESFDSTEYASDSKKKHKGSWGIYIYMCGSDLETGAGAASSDIEEMLDAQLGEDVTVVIQTGGAKKWNKKISAKKLERFVYTKDGMSRVDRRKNASMGSKKTLTKFLTFCKEEYPADNQMVIFWNHGGGSLGGVCYDEIYDYDHLTLNDIDEAFTDSFGKKRIDAIGFDCCLMASIDTANSCKNHAEMMIASEETEPGNGWYYTDWLTALSKEPTMSNEKLGKKICDSYMEDCERYGTDYDATLSVVDLNKINLVVDSVNELSQEMFQKLSKNDKKVMTKIGRIAKKTENYGGNTDKLGYFDLMDLGDFIASSGKDYFAARKRVEENIRKAVLYNVCGFMHDKSTGISIFYPYDKELASLQKYEAVAASDLHAAFQRVMLTGKASKHTYELLDMYSEAQNEENTTEAVEIEEETKDYTFTNDGKDLPIKVNKEGYLTVEVGKENIQKVESVKAKLLYYLEDSDTYVCFGTDSDVEVDWDKGKITDDFYSARPCMDGNLLYMDLCSQEEHYNLYSSPILLNGERKEMSVIYDFDKEKFEIMGVSDLVDASTSNQCAVREEQQLKKGDKITPIFYYYDYDSEAWEELEMDDFKYKKDTAIVDEDLFDGEYAIMFITQDVAGNEVYSDYGYIHLEDGEIEAYTE